MIIDTKVPSTNRPGFALPILLMLLVLGSVGAMAAAAMATQQARQSGVLSSSVRALHAAEAGGALVLNSFASGELGWAADGEYTGTAIEGLYGDVAPTSEEDATTHDRSVWWVSRMEFQGNVATVRIVGQDASGRARREIEVEYTRGGSSAVYPFATAVLGCEGIDLGGSGAIDSYDSNEGPYQSWNARANADVATLNGNVTLPGATRIKGDLHVGGTLTYSGSAAVLGVVQATQNVNFSGGSPCPDTTVMAGGNISDPGNWWCQSARDRLEPNASVSPPQGVCDQLGVDSLAADYLAAGWGGPVDGSNYSGWQANDIEFANDVRFENGLNLGATTNMSFESGSMDRIYMNGDLRAGGSSRIRFESPAAGENGMVNLFIDGDFTLLGSADFIIEPGAAVQVFVTGEVDLGAGLSNQNPAPTMTVVQGGETVVIPTFSIFSSYDGANGVRVGGAAQVFASVYAPHTDVDIAGSGGLYGAVTGGTVDVSGAGGIHYDEALSDFASGSGAAATESVVSHWVEVF